MENIHDETSSLAYVCSEARLCVQQESMSTRRHRAEIHYFPVMKRARVEVLAENDDRPPHHDGGDDDDDGHV